ncbi:hypothetical protein KI387_030967, partial [Taxus chinensis]
ISEVRIEIGTSGGAPQWRLHNVLQLLLQLGTFCKAGDGAAIAGAMLYITNEFKLDEGTTGLLIAISIIGGLCSTLMAGVFADTFGRRKILSMAGILYLLSACGMAMSPTVSILITARFLVGCAYGLSSTVVPLLISETAPSNIRGQLATFPQLTNSLGTFTAYCVVFSFSLLGDKASWRLMTAALGAPAVVYIALCFLYIPESPRWLVRKGRMTEAKHTLQRLLNKEDVSDDLALVVEGLGSGKGVTIEEYVVEHAETITGNEQEKQDGDTIRLYGLEEEWIAKPASCVESAPITSYRLMDSTVALIKSFQQIPLSENVDQTDEAHESSQWDMENQVHEAQSDSEEEEETPSILEESVPNTPLLDHDWGLERSNSNQPDSLRTPFLPQENSSYAERKTARGKVNWSTEYLNNLQSAGNVKNSSKNSCHMSSSLNGSFPEQGMGLGGGWQVAYQLQQSQSNQSGSLKRVFLYAGSASHIASDMSSIRSLKSFHGLEGRETVQVSALVGEPALCLTENNYKSSGGSVVGPAIMHPSQMSTEGILWSDFRDIRVKRALTVGMTLQMLQQFCGISVVLFYTPSILREAHVDTVLGDLININVNSAALLASAISAMPMLIFIVLGMWLMDRAGRRAILLYTTPILFIIMIIMGLVKLIHLGSAVRSSILIGCIMAFLSFFNMGFGAIPNIVCSEIFPTKVRGACLGICGLTMFLCTTIVTLSFPTLNKRFGAPAVFGFFAAISLVSWVFTFLKVPETKGIPLEVITEFFAAKKVGVNEEHKS